MTIVTNFQVLSTPVSDKAKAIAKAAAEQAAGAKQAGIKGLATGRSDTFRVNPYSLQIKDGWNSREIDTVENQEHIDNLAQSIAENGVKVPLRVYIEGGTLFVSDGHCRLLATLRAIEEYGAEVLSVPVITEDRTANDADRILTQIIANSGKPLTPFEQSTVFKKLYDLGWTEQQIAKRAARSLTHVNQLLELQAAPEKVKALVRSGQVSATTARDVVKSATSDAEAVETLTKAVEVAGEQGKTKATGKHVRTANGEAATKVNLKKSLKDAFDAADIDNSDDAKVTVTFDAETFETVRKLLGL